MKRLLMILMIVAGVVAAIIAALTMHGCATTRAVAAACAATSLQSQQILDKLGNPSQAAALAGLDGLHFAACVIAGEIDAYLAAHQDDGGAHEFAAMDPLDAVRLRNARAWRAAHQ